MKPSRSNTLWLITTTLVLLVVGTAIYVNREPRHGGKTASEWFEDAQRSSAHLHRYGEMFRGWEERGAEFLCRKLTVDQGPMRRHLSPAYNRIAARMGWSIMPLRSDAETRQTARRLLGYFEVDAIPALQTLARSGTELNRVAAVQAMSELGPAAADELGLVLIPLLRDPSATLQYEAITTLAALECMPETVVPLLVPFLTNHIERVRVEASYALGCYPPRPELTLSPLVGALGDSSATVRANALRAIGRMGEDGGTAFDAVVNCLGDSSSLVWARTVESIPFIVEPDRIVGTYDYGTKLETILARNTPYHVMMVSRGVLRLGLEAEKMESACTALVKAKPNWQVWEAVDAMAEIEPRPDWAESLLRQAMQHPNGTVRAKAQAALPD